MEEEKARQEAANKGSSESGSSSSAMVTDAPKSASAMEGDEDAMLAKALAMSMGKTEDEDVKMQDLTEEDQIARAIELSMSAGGTAASTSQTAPLDPSFMNSVLGSLPGVDPNDPRIKTAIAKQKEEEEKKDGSK